MLKTRFAVKNSWPFGSILEQSYLEVAGSGSTRKQASCRFSDQDITRAVPCAHSRLSLLFNSVYALPSPNKRTTGAIRSLRSIHRPEIATSVFIPRPYSHPYLPSWSPESIDTWVEANFRWRPEFRASRIQLCCAAVAPCG